MVGGRVKNGLIQHSSSSINLAVFRRSFRNIDKHWPTFLIQQFVIQQCFCWMRMLDLQKVMTC